MVLTSRRKGIKVGISSDGVLPQRRPLPIPSGHSGAVLDPSVDHIHYLPGPLRIKSTEQDEHHAQRVWHCLFSIKLENIVFDRKFQPKIADMELAWRAQSSFSKERPRDNVGTYDYQAPEVINPDEEGYNQIQKDLDKTLDLGGYNYNVDVYSLGCVLYYLLYLDSGCCFPTATYPSIKLPNLQFSIKLRVRTSFCTNWRKKCLKKTGIKERMLLRYFKNKNLKRYLPRLMLKKCRNLLLKRNSGRKRCLSRKFTKTRQDF